MDFAPYALDALYELAVKSTRILRTDDAKAYVGIAMDLEKAFKFIVPSPTSLNVKVTESALPFMRLPYPVCAFEYVIDNPATEGLVGLETQASSKRIALAYDLEAPTPFILAGKQAGYIQPKARGIAVISIYYIDAMKRWMPSIGFGVFDVNDMITRAEVKNFYLQGKSFKECPKEIDHDLLLGNDVTYYAFGSYPLTHDARYDIARGGEVGRMMRMNIANDVTEELAMAMRVALMLNAKNLKIVQAIEAPAALNKKRKAKNRSVFYDYHTIDIFLTPDGTRVQRKKVNSSNLKYKLFRSNSGLHAVIGHFKTRKTGIYWWNSFARGSSKHGVIKKDYHVQKEKPRA